MGMMTVSTSWGCEDAMINIGKLFRIVLASQLKVLILFNDRYPFIFSLGWEEQWEGLNVVSITLRVRGELSVLLFLKLKRFFTSFFSLLLGGVLKVNSG